MLLGAQVKWSDTSGCRRCTQFHQLDFSGTLYKIGRWRLVAGRKRDGVSDSQVKACDMQNVSPQCRFSADSKCRLSVRNGLRVSWWASTAIDWFENSNVSCLPSHLLHPMQPTVLSPSLANASAAILTLAGSHPTLHCHVWLSVSDSAEVCKQSTTTTTFCFHIGKIPVLR